MTRVHLKMQGRNSETEECKEDFISNLTKTLTIVTRFTHSMDLLDFLP